MSRKRCGQRSLRRTREVGDDAPLAMGRRTSICPLRPPLLPPQRGHHAAHDGVRMLVRSIRFPRTVPSCNLHEILHSKRANVVPRLNAYATRRRRESRCVRRASRPSIRRMARSGPSWMLALLRRVCTTPATSTTPVASASWPPSPARRATRWSSRRSRFFVTWSTAVPPAPSPTPVTAPAFSRRSRTRSSVRWPDSSCPRRLLRGRYRLPPGGDGDRRGPDSRRSRLTYRDDRRRRGSYRPWLA